MSDFLQRESDLLGGEFSTVGAGGGGDDDDFDFDRAASAFPDISLDGGVPEAPAPAAGRSTSGYSLDAFSTPQPAVTVTGDDDLDKFENEYPDLGPAVRSSSNRKATFIDVCSSRPHSPRLLSRPNPRTLFPPLRFWPRLPLKMTPL